MRKSNILWGLLLLLGAVFILASHMGMAEGISIITVIFTVLFAGILIDSLVHLSFGGIFFSLAFLAIIYSDILGLDAITPWPVLGAALLGSIGCDMIFPHKYRKNKHCYSRKQYDTYDKTNNNKQYKEEGFDNIIDEEDSNIVRCTTKFSSAIKYVNTDQFESAEIECSFGGAKVFFDNATLKGNTATINLEVSFAGVELFIPRTWNVVNHAEVSFGGIEEKNKAVPAEGAPTIYLVGDVSFAGVTIIYV